MPGISCPLAGSPQSPIRVGAMPGISCPLAGSPHGICSIVEPGISCPLADSLAKFSRMASSMSCSSTLFAAFIIFDLDMWRDGLLSIKVVLDEPRTVVVLDERMGTVDTTVGSSTVKTSNLFLTLVMYFAGKSDIVMTRGLGLRGCSTGFG